MQALTCFVHTVESLQSYCIRTQFHWSTRLLPVMRDRVQSPGGYLSETGILLLALPRYIGDPNVIDHCGLVWGGLRPEQSLGRHADNVIIPLDFTQLFCPGFMLAAGLPSGFTTNIVSCCGEPAFIHSSTGPVVHPFASCHEGPRFNPQGVLTWHWDSPISVVSLQYNCCFAPPVMFNILEQLYRWRCWREVVHPCPVLMINWLRLGRFVHTFTSKLAYTYKSPKI